MQQTPKETRPLVSVVTPFFNTAEYLAQSIESVLDQSFNQFEYILLDNCSTDGSREIAEKYASMDSRIRLIRASEFVSQLENYNRALSGISQYSKYCKIVSADDYIFPRCLELMVKAFEQSDTIGLVSSYTLKGSEVLGSGYPYPMPFISGREWARRYLRSAPFAFGSPTTVMYRAAVVREKKRFFSEIAINSDTEKCMELLEKWDFGFVHQILSFLRADNESISFGRKDFLPFVLDFYIISQRFAPVFFQPEEAKILRKKSKREYYRTLASQAVRIRGAAFWRFHRAGLASLEQNLDLPYLALQVTIVLLNAALNPGRSTKLLLSYCKNRLAS